MLYSLELSIISLLLPAPICCKQHYCTPNYTSFVLYHSIPPQSISSLKTAANRSCCWYSASRMTVKTDVAWMLLSDVGQTLQ